MKKSRPDALIAKLRTLALGGVYLENEDVLLQVSSVKVTHRRSRDTSNPSDRTAS